MDKIRKTRDKINLVFFFLIENVFFVALLTNSLYRTMGAIKNETLLYW